MTHDHPMYGQRDERRVESDSAVDTPQDSPYVEQTGSYEPFNVEKLSEGSIRALGDQAIGGDDVVRRGMRLDASDQDRRINRTYTDTPEPTPEERAAAHEQYLDMPRFLRPRRQSMKSQEIATLEGMYNYDRNRDNPEAAVARAKEARRQRDIAPRLKGGASETPTDK